MKLTMTKKHALNSLKYLAPLWVAFNSIAYEDAPTPIRHHPVENFKDDPSAYIAQVLHSSIPTALTVDGLDTVVILSASSYSQLIKKP